VILLEANKMLGGRAKTGTFETKDGKKLSYV
jgi:hypothetical protein